MEFKVGHFVSFILPDSSNKVTGAGIIIKITSNFYYVNAKIINPPWFKKEVILIEKEMKLATEPNEILKDLL